MLKRIITLSILLIITALVFHSGLCGEFVLDDEYSVHRNPVLALSNPIPFLGTGFLKSYLSGDSSIAPLVQLSYWLDLRLWGLNPWGFRLTNIFLHLLTVFFVYRLLRRLIFKDDFVKTVIATAFFTLNPVQISAVTYISGRPAIFVALFTILALSFYRSFEKSPSVFGKISVLLFVLLGLFTGKAGLIVPCVVLIMESIRGGNKLWALKSVVLALVAGFYFFASYSNKLISFPAGHYPDIVSTIILAPFVFVKYLSLVFAPISHSPFRTLTSVYTDRTLPILVGLLTSGAYIWLMVALWRKGRIKFVFSMLLIILGLLPTLFVFDGDIIPENALYLPSIGAAVLFAIILAKIGDAIRKKSPKLSPEIIIAVAILLYFANTAYLRNFRWTNEFLLAQSSIEDDGPTAPALTSISGMMFEMGEFDSTVIYANRAASIDPTDFDAWNCLALGYSGLGMNDAALWVLDTRFWTDRSFRYSERMLSTGKIYLNKGEISSARASFYKSTIREDFAPAYIELGKLVYDNGEYNLAIELLEKGTKLDPFNPKIYGLLALAYEANSDNVSAREAWHRYLELPGVKYGETVGEEDVPGILPTRKTKGD